MLAASVSLAGAPAWAKDLPLRVLLDGRPLDKTGPSGLIHRDTAFINVVRGTKTFSGLLVFGKNDHSVTVTIRHQTARFVMGTREGMMGGEPARFPGAPFILNGDVYVPLASFARLAGVGLSVDAKHGVARLNSPG
jgi:hypothetical protein